MLLWVRISIEEVIEEIHTQNKLRLWFGGQKYGGLGSKIDFSPSLRITDRNDVRIPAIA